MREWVTENWRLSIEGFSRIGCGAASVEAYCDGHNQRARGSRSWESIMIEIC